VINKRQRIIEILTTAMEKPEIANALIQRVINELNKTQPEPEQINYEEWKYNPMTGEALWNEQPEIPKREWVGLTTDEVFELSSTKLPHGLFAGLIERKLREKNGA
jgi:hypothetical protein